MSAHGSDAGPCLEVHGEKAFLPAGGSLQQFKVNGETSLLERQDGVVPVRPDYFKEAVGAPTEVGVLRVKREATLNDVVVALHGGVVVR